MASVQLFYHYTSTAGANGIRKDGIIRSKNAVKLSTLQPEDHTRDAILRSIYGNTIPSERKNRADNVVFVSESVLDTSMLHEITPALFGYSDEVRVSANDVSDKPACVNRGSSWGSSNQRSTGSSQYYTQFLYHYTNTDTVFIRSSGCIPFSNGGTVLLTQMKPTDYFRDEILKIIYGKDYDRKRYAASADWCIKIDSTRLNVNKLNQCNGKLYEYSGSIRVDPSNVMDKPKCGKGGKNQSISQEYLYHYTNTRGAEAIKATGYLKMSGSSGAFGVGVYMTKLKPTDFFRDDILKNNYGGINSAFKGRADWVVRVKSSDLVKSKLKSVDSNITNDPSREIYVYEDIVTVNSSDVFDKPKCYRAK